MMRDLLRQALGFLLMMLGVVTNSLVIWATVIAIVAGALGLVLGMLTGCSNADAVAATATQNADGSVTFAATVDKDSAEALRQELQAIRDYQEAKAEEAKATDETTGGEDAETTPAEGEGTAAPAGGNTQGQPSQGNQQQGGSGGSGNSGSGSNTGNAGGSGGSGASEQPAQQQGGGSQQQQQPAQPKRHWVEEQGHYEPTYEEQSVWVEPVYKYIGEYYRMSDGAELYDAASADAYQAAHAVACVEATGNKQIMISNGYWTKQQVQVGQHWVVDVPGHWEEG